MWEWLARRYQHTERIAGYEVMSEPRTKTLHLTCISGVSRVYLGR